MWIDLIRERKKLLGVTNAQLAEQSGVSISTLSKVLSGITPNPQLETVRAIAQPLGISLDELYAASASSLSPSALTIAAAYDNAPPLIQDTAYRVLEPFMVTQKNAAPEDDDPIVTADQVLISSGLLPLDDDDQQGIAEQEAGEA